MLILVGESASGKSSIEKYLCECFGYNKLISYTTRSPRENEQDGVDYHFVSEEKFNELKSQSFFAEVGCYNGWYYGSAIEDCTNDKVAVLTPHGLRQLKKNTNLNIFTVYINVSRRDRLIKILQRGDNIEEAIRRNISDVGQFDGIQDEVDVVIDNPNYRQSIHKLSLLVNEKYEKWGYKAKVNKNGKENT